jgi:hypothetical protein
VAAAPIPAIVPPIPIILIMSGTVNVVSLVGGVVVVGTVGVTTVGAVAVGTVGTVVITGISGCVGLGAVTSTVGGAVVPPPKIDVTALITSGDTCSGLVAVVTTVGTCERVLIKSVEVIGVLAALTSKVSDAPVTGNALVIDAISAALAFSKN